MTEGRFEEGDEGSYEDHLAKGDEEVEGHEVEDEGWEGGGGRGGRGGRWEFMGMVVGGDKRGCFVGRVSGWRVWV